MPDITYFSSSSEQAARNSSPFAPLFSYKDGQQAPHASAVCSTSSVTEALQFLSLAWASVGNSTFTFSFKPSTFGPRHDLILMIDDIFSLLNLHLSNSQRF